MAKASGSSNPTHRKSPRKSQGPSSHTKHPRKNPLLSDPGAIQASKHQRAQKKASNNSRSKISKTRLEELTAELDSQYTHTMDQTRFIQSSCDTERINSLPLRISEEMTSESLLKTSEESTMQGLATILGAL